MDRDLAAGDDYLEHAKSALEEASSEIGSAATVFIENDTTRTELGRALGQARNAIARALHDIAAHQSREQRFQDRDSVQHYLATLATDPDTKPYFSVTIAPLPLEDDRLSQDIFKERTFANDFTVAITRFNNEERRRNPFLMEVPGGMSGYPESGHFAFNAVAQGAREPTQWAWLFDNGTFIFKMRLFEWQTPPAYPLEYLLDYFGAAVRFVVRLYEERGIAPRALAVQGTISNADQFQLGVAGAFGQTTVLDRSKPGPLSIPDSPIVIPFSSSEDVLTRARVRVEAAVLAAHRASHSA